MSSIFSTDADENAHRHEAHDEIHAVRRGANWFYWIAGLSLVNSAVYIFGGNVSFVAGLAVTQIVDALSDAAVAAGAPSALKGVAVIIDLGIAAMFALFGYYAGKGKSAVFITGIILYGIDTLLCLLIESWFAAAFHAYALFAITGGLLASRRMNEYRTA